MVVKKIKISGFRGLLVPFTLDFKKGNSLRSAVIYGMNGTGKSSITDAWEWFHSGKIDHLKREGAKASSYPHREASRGDTFVEIDLKDEILEESLCKEFDHDRITIPKKKGDFSSFEENAPYPCHLRHKDLSQFVYYTKTKKYDKLANLMGFEKQLNFQKSLKRVSRKLKAKFENVEEEKERMETKLLNHIELESFDEEILTTMLNQRLKKWNLDEFEKDSELSYIIDLLRAKIESDPLAEKLSCLEDYKNELENINIKNKLCERIDLFIENLEDFLKKEISISRIILIDLYEQGKSILEEHTKYKRDENICPLCGQTYLGNLREHIDSELNKLEDLKQLVDKLNTKKKIILSELPDIKNIKSKKEKANIVFKEIDLDLPSQKLIEELESIIQEINKIYDLLQWDFENLSIDELKKLQATNSNLNEFIDKYKENKKNILNRVKKKIEDLKANENRQKLVEDYEWLKKLKDLKKEYLSIEKKYLSLKELKLNYTKTVENFVEKNVKNVKARFNDISEDVSKYYNTIEKRTAGISNPNIKLLTDPNRAVILEIIFHEEKVSPAYKYLSESQLNSFGLAIFLAAVSNFNDFKFVILDDIVNSFDAYKRPEIIQLLRDEFSDFQILILTHDKVWYKQITENFPSWIKLRFNRYVFGSGPIVDIGKTKLEEIHDLLDKDKPIDAGRLLGPLMERQLQLISELFNVKVKYKRDNRYNLRSLIQFFQSRIKNKLTRGHELYDKINKFQNSIYFRNFCSHWKNPSSPLTREEVLYVVNDWEEILDFIKCDCGRILEYNGSNTFECQCGGKSLEKP
jgi:DNA repair exonuclease SbcCD ATPase subunit